MQVDIYSKPTCPLCDEAKAVLERVQARIPFELRVVNIDENPALFAAYRYDIPVVFIDGHKAFQHRLVEDEVEACLRQAMRGTGVAGPGPQGE